uniref:hypothetical protein n=1 Tax=Yoonia sp. TaxID=2212373 RepID=UPI00404847E9
MTTTITTHKRGFFGRLWQIVFWLFQAMMIAMIFFNFSAVSDTASVACDGDTACQAGAVIGGGMIAAVGWFVWIIGTIIFGILMLSTRGKLVSKSL